MSFLGTTILRGTGALKFPTRAPLQAGTYSPISVAKVMSVEAQVTLHGFVQEAVRGPSDIFGRITVDLSYANTFSVSCGFPSTSYTVTETATGAVEYLAAPFVPRYKIDAIAGSAERTTGGATCGPAACSATAERDGAGPCGQGWRWSNSCLPIYESADRLSYSAPRTPEDLTGALDAVFARFRYQDEAGKPLEWGQRLLAGMLLDSLDQMECKPRQIQVGPVNSASSVSDVLAQIQDPCGGAPTDQLLRRDQPRPCGDYSMVQGYFSAYFTTDARDPAARVTASERRLRFLPEHEFYWAVRTPQLFGTEERKDFPIVCERVACQRGKPVEIIVPRDQPGSIAVLFVRVEFFGQGCQEFRNLPPFYRAG